MYCNTLHCIVAGRAAGGQVVSQYNLEYRGKRQGCLCRKTGSRVVIQQAGRWCAQAWSLGRAGVGAGACKATGARAQVGARAWARTEAQASSRAREASGSWARAHAGGSGAGGARQGAAGATGAAGARPGFGLCTQCTRPIFGPVRLGIFPESPNEHYSL